MHRRDRNSRRKPNENSNKTKQNRSGYKQTSKETQNQGSMHQNQDNSVRGRMGNYMRSPEGKAFAYGAGTMLLALMLFPTAKKGIRPAVKKAVQGGLAFSEKVQEVIASAREGLEDLVAEAHFEQLQENVAKDIAIDLSELKK